MSDPNETPKQAPELKEDELEQITGGAVDVFLKIDGVDGESQDAKHKREIE